MLLPFAHPSTQRPSRHVVARLVHPSDLHARDSSNGYLVALLRNVMRSLRSLAFFMPAKAILVPGMYFFGFSR
jgi:hypothetical protein